MCYAVWSRVYPDVLLCRIVIRWTNSAMTNTAASNTLDCVAGWFLTDSHSIGRQTLIHSSRNFRCLNEMVTWIQRLVVMCLAYLVCLVMPNWILSSNVAPFDDSSCHLFATEKETGKVERKNQQKYNLMWCYPLFATEKVSKGERVKVSEWGRMLELEMEKQKRERERKRHEAMKVHCSALRYCQQSFWRIPTRKICAHVNVNSSINNVSFKVFGTANG